MTRHLIAGTRWLSHLCPIRYALSALLIAFLPLTAWAQEAEQAPWFQVRVVEVKRDRVDEFEDLVSTLAAANRESDAPPFTVFEVVRGPINTYHVVTSVQSLAELDDPAEPAMAPADMAAWESRIAKTEKSHHFFISQVFPEYGNQVDGAEPSQFTVLRTVRTKPERTQDYQAWIEDSLAPAMREAGIGHTVSRGFLGQDVDTWYHASPVDDWAAFEGPGPFVEALGEKRAAKLFAGVADMIESNELTVLRMRPDLSAPAE